MKKEKVKFIRPPRTSDEAIKTLKEADIRYDINNQFLTGKSN
jgi:hypothetical protein